MKKASLIVIPLVLSLLYLTAVVIAGFQLNKIIVREAQKLEQEARIVENPQERLLKFIQSDYLKPDNGKKIEIVKTFYLLNAPQRAERWLFGLRGDEKNYALSEYYLEQGEYEKAEDYLRLIDREEIKEELEIFEKFSKGEYQTITDLPTEPITNLGYLLKVMNTKQGLDENYYSYYLSLLKVLPANSLNNGIAFVNSLKEGNQPYLALFILNEMEKQYPGTALINTKKAEIYEEQNKLEAAAGELEKAIENQPENIELYKEIKDIYQKEGNDSKENYYQEIINYLTKILI